MPAGTGNIYLFDGLNAFSWTVVLGTPMFLYYQHLNASATVMAIGASLAPVLNVLQIPAADYVERVGYRRFVLAGWSARSVLVVAMAVVASISSWLPTAEGIGFMLALALTYNVLRGFSACGLLPWFTHLIPEARRGRFLARDQAGVAAAGLLCLLVCGVLVSVLKSRLTFGFVFGLSAAAAFASLVFLRRIPDVAVEKSGKAGGAVPWREIVRYRPFQVYLRYNVLVNLALGAAMVFWVRYFRLFLHVSEGRVLAVACAINATMVLSLLVLGRLADHVGNKPLLFASGLLFMTHFLGWALVAAQWLPFNPGMLATQVLTVGMGTALWNMANVRCVMSIVPVMGRPHFLALYSVASSLTYGCAPLVWGPVLDRLAGWRVAGPYGVWNCFSLFYLVLMGIMGTSLVALGQLKEPARLSRERLMRELLVRTPGRALARLLLRLQEPEV